MLENGRGIKPDMPQHCAVIGGMRGQRRSGVRGAEALDDKR